MAFGSEHLTRIWLFMSQLSRDSAGSGAVLAVWGLHIILSGIPSSWKAGPAQQHFAMLGVGGVAVIALTLHLFAFLALANVDIWDHTSRYVLSRFSPQVIPNSSFSILFIILFTFFDFAHTRAGVHGVHSGGYGKCTCGNGIVQAKVSFHVHPFGPCGTADSHGWASMEQDESRLQQPCASVG